MAAVRDRSTYAQLIDDVRFDLNRDAELSSLPDEAIQVWILRAEAEICQLIPVREEYALGLNEDVSDYIFQDRPPITDASDGTPVVVTANAHGLSNGDTIFITGVLGNTAANGTFIVANKSTNDFELTDEDGGDVPGVVTYISGGRFWRDDEIPTFFKAIREISRVWSGVTLPVNLVGIQNIIDRQQYDEFNAFTGYTAPTLAALVEEDRKRYLKFYPTPTEDAAATLYGYMMVVPKDYTGDALSVQIHLTVAYNELIKARVTAYIHGWLKEHDLRRAFYGEFRQMINDWIRTMVVQRRMEVNTA